jgi:hypothetical protein
MARNELLDLGEEVLDQMARRIELSVIVARIGLDRILGLTAIAAAILSSPWGHAMAMDASFTLLPDALPQGELHKVLQSEILPGRRDPSRGR